MEQVPLAGRFRLRAAYLLRVALRLRAAAFRCGSFRLRAGNSATMPLRRLAIACGEGGVYAEAFGVPVMRGNRHRRMQIQVNDGASP